MKDIILGILAVTTLIATIALLKGNKRKNENGLCSVDCSECSEKDWCIFRYKG